MAAAWAHEDAGTESETCGVPFSKPSRLKHEGMRKASSREIDTCSDSGQLIELSSAMSVITSNLSSQNAKLDEILQSLAQRDAPRLPISSQPNLDGNRLVSGGSVMSPASGRSDRRSEHGGSQSSSTTDHKTETTRRGVMSSRLSAHERLEIQHMETAREASVMKHQKERQETLQTDSVCSPCAWARRVVSRAEFQGLMMIMILVNCLLTGIEVDMGSSLSDEDLPEAFAVLNVTFVACFLVELALKLLAIGCRDFFRGDDASWNAFDFVIIMISVCEVMVDLSVSALETAVFNLGNLRVLRVLRLARAFRGIRVLRVLKVVSSLRTLLFSIVSTIKSLVWTVFLLFLLFYAFGVALTQLVADHCRLEAIEATSNMNAAPDCAASPMGAQFEDYWSSLPQSMMTLFMAITGGMSWELAFRALLQVSWLAAGLFLLYVFFTVFCVLNVVTGVFCNTAIESANADRDMAALTQISNQKRYVETISRMFSEIDNDASNVVTLEEFEEALKDEKLAAYLQSIDIPSRDAWALFSMIDTDMSGHIDLEEFVEGCLQLRGTAKAIHIAKLHFEGKLTQRKLTRLSADTDKMLNQQQSIIKALSQAQCNPTV